MTPPRLPRALRSVEHRIPGHGRVVQALAPGFQIAEVDASTLARACQAHDIRLLQAFPGGRAGAFFMQEGAGPVGQEWRATFLIHLIVLARDVPARARFLSYDPKDPEGSGDWTERVDEARSNVPITPLVPMRFKELLPELYEEAK